MEKKDPVEYGYLQARGEAHPCWPNEIERHDVPFDDRALVDVWKLLRELSEREVPLAAVVLDAIKEERVLVAVVGGKVVGMVTLCFDRTLGGRYATIRDVIVTSAWRRHGIAETLMGIAHRVAKAEGVVRVQLTSRAHRAEAHRFYEKLGYERIDTHVYRMALR